MQQKNFKPKDVVMASFYQACKAYLVHDFDRYMKQLADCNPRAYQYVQEIEPARWARCHFPGRRYSLMTTNIAESMNNALLHARDKPIVPMIEHIRSLLQRWFHERRTCAANMPGPVTPEVENELKMRHQASIRLHVVAISFYEFQVTGTPLEAVVNLLTKSCSCREFDLDQYPCVHALASCRSRNISYYSMCSHYYTVEALQNAYAESIVPVGDKSLWDIPSDVSSRQVLPPDMARRTAGRPRKQRIPSAGEERMLRRCGRCNKLGHNRQTCKNPVPLNKSPNVAMSRTNCNNL